MSEKTVLIITTYPIKNPKHGGQKRVAAITNEYSKIFLRVVNCAVFFKGFYSDYDSNDIPLGKDSEEEISGSPFTGDMVCGEAIYNDRVVKRRISKLISRVKPDIIHIEQPFPYLGLKKLLEELNIKPKIIFGSQNIEAPMKHDILGNSKDENTIKIIKRIDNLEKDLSKKADIVVACTENDVEAHKKMGAKTTVLAPNGVAEFLYKKEDSLFWTKKFEAKGIKKIALFIGSAHPPNWIGFDEMIGRSVGFMPIDTRIVLAGGICDYFRDDIGRGHDIESATFFQRVFLAGKLSESKLQGLIDAAEVILLPMTEGGGSNLKTAEAIQADKKVVATSHSLRSFEWFKDFPNVWVADSKKAFKDSVNEALQAEKLSRSPDQLEKAKEVLWANRLKQFMQEVRKIA